MIKKVFVWAVLWYCFVSAHTVTEVVYFSQSDPAENFATGQKESFFSHVCYPRSIKILLPVGARAASVRTLYENPETVRDNVTAEATADRAANITRRDGLPADMLRESGTAYTFFKWGVPIAVTTVTPFRYDSAQRKVYCYRKVTVTIQTEPVNASMDLAAYKCTPFTRSILKTIVHNKDAVDNLPLTGRDADDYDYLIISRDDMYPDGWNDLVAFNKRRGMKTEVHSIKDILQDPQNTGVDYPEKLRTFIKREYTEDKITFVLLGGDYDSSDASNSIPYRELFSKFYDHYHRPDRYREEYSATDLYYEGLDGDWKGSESDWGLPGNEDIGAEVYVARFPIDGAADYQNMLNKTVMYSENPVKNEVKRALFLGDKLWKNANNPEEYIWGIDYVLQHLGQCNNYGFTTYGIPDDGSWAIDSLSDKMNNGSQSWGNSGLKTKIDNFYPTIISHTGLANHQYGCQTEMAYINDSWITNDGVNHNFFLILLASGFSGEFNKVDDCWGEQMVTISHGAVAGHLYNNSTFGDDDGNNSPEIRLTRYFFDALFNQTKKIHFIEAMHTASREANIDIILANDTSATDPTGYFGIIRYCAYNTNVFGDPALSVWTDIPDSLVPGYSTPLSDSSFEISGLPPYTWVALLTTGDSIICNQLTGYNGECVISDQTLADYVTANPAGLLKVNIKAHNYYPFQGDLPIQINNLIIPELFDTSGSTASLPAAKRLTSDTVDLYYQLLDIQGRSDTISVQYRTGTFGTWTAATHTSGDVGTVSGADSSVHRHIIWSPLTQLGTSFESDSVQLRLIAKGPTGTSDTIATSKPDMNLDFKAPAEVTSLTASAQTSFKIFVTWHASISHDADTHVVVWSTSTIGDISDTAGNEWVPILDPEHSLTVDSLKPATLYYFKVFARDEAANWNNGVSTSAKTLNKPPLCSIDPISVNQSDSVVLTLGFADEESETIHVTCEYSTDGNIWQNTKLIDLPDSIPSSLYESQKITAIWPSKNIWPDADIKGVYLRVTPFDSDTGSADTVLMNIDNYHNQSIVLTTPTGEQNDDIAIPFTVTDTTGDSLTLECQYSIDGGIAWAPTNNVDLTIIGPRHYSDTITWHSSADISTQNITTVRFAIAPSDGWGAGTPDTTGNFHVNNLGIPLVVYIIKHPTVSHDTVSLAVRITAPAFNAVTIDKAEYSIQDGTRHTATLSSGTIIQSADYDSAVIIWASKKNITDNATDVKLHFTFSAGTNTKSLTTQAFNLANNTKPAIRVTPVTGIQNGDVDIAYTLSDTDADTLGITVQYSENGTVWHAATVSGITDGIAPSNYTNTVTWKSATDFPDALQKSIWIKITPFDQDTGICDSLQIIITNKGIPSCDPLTLTGGDTLSDTITIRYTLKDKDNDTLSITVHYLSDTGWVATTNVAGKTTGITAADYTGSVIWLSNIDLPNTFSKKMQVKITPSDKNFIGQSGESSPFVLNNLDSTVSITGDFNKDGAVDFLDFSYVSTYWYKSANGINHPDSIVELAPATGEPPYLTVVPDSLFNYEDLAVFIQMYYWSGEHGKTTMPSDVCTAPPEDAKAQFTLSGDNNRLDLHCRVQNINGLVSCQFIAAYNENILSYASFDEKGLLGRVFSRIEQTRCTVAGNMTRLSRSSLVVSGTGKLAVFHFNRKKNKRTEITITYRLINNNHEIMESGVMRIPVNEYKEPAVDLTIIPNPSRVSSQTIPFEMSNFSNSTAQVNAKREGFILRVSFDDKDNTRIMQAQLSIVDALGNTVITTPLTPVNPEIQTMDIFWNGCNRRGRKVGSGMYDVLLYYHNGKNKGVIKRKLGVVD